MFEKVTRVILAAILTLAVILGGMLAYQRHNVEGASKTVELAMDWRDLRMLSALSKYPIDKLLSDVRSNGITSIGVLEETLTDATLLGEVYCASGSGILRFKGLNPILSSLSSKKAIKPGSTYILCYNPEIRKRVQRQLHYFLPKNSLKNLGEKVFEISESDVILKDAGVGISEAYKRYLTKKGFSIIPRLSNDPRYDVPGKISELSGYHAIIFDGEEILGYPDKIVLLSLALKKNRIKYGNIEIIKQDGDQQLKRLMGTQMIRVHSIPKDEILKITKDEAEIRFVRAVKERSIRLIYLRPFLPPQILEDPVIFNLAYLSEVKQMIEKAGYSLGKASSPADFYPAGWQIIFLGIGVLIVTLLLIDLFLPLPWYLIWPVLILSPLVMVYIGAGSRQYPLEKGLALLAAVAVPSYAVISQYSRKNKIFSSPNIIINSIYLTLNVVAECAVGIFLILGLLANTNFMMGANSFAGVKLALVIPILIIAAYFIPKSKEKITNLLNQKIPFYYIIVALALIFVLGVFLARSGNFTLPVPEAEKIARSALETVLGVRPRTKEFLIGYPLLIIAGILFLKEKKDWLWLFLAVGAVGPISLVNSFSHIHTPIVISVLRSINGLVLGLILGAVAGMIYIRFSKK